MKKPLSPLHRIKIVANARAASDVSFRTAVKKFRDKGYDIDVSVLWETGDGSRFTKEALRNGHRLIIAAGGDGTLNEVVNGFLLEKNREGRAVGLLPYGTANDFATACGVPLRNTIAALQAAATQQTMVLDVDWANERYFLNAATGGYPAQVTSKAPDQLKNTLGRLAYFFTGLRDLSRISPRKARLEAPGFSWRGPIVGMALGNGRQAGGGIRFAPRASLVDGLIDLLIVPELAIKQLMLGVKDILNPNGARPFRHLISLRVPWLEVAIEGTFQFNLDGEPTRGSRVRFDVLHRALPFRLPKSALTIPLAGNDSSVA